MSAIPKREEHGVGTSEALEKAAEVTAVATPVAAGVWAFIRRQVKFSSRLTTVERDVAEIKDDVKFLIRRLIEERE